MVVVSARDPRVPSGGPHRRSGIARTHQSTLLCWSSLRSWYWLMLRLTAVFTAVPASEPAMPSADMPTGRAAPLRSEGETRASPRVGRVRLEARVMSFIRNAYRCLQLSL